MPVDFLTKESYTKRHILFFLVLYNWIFFKKYRVLVIIYKLFTILMSEMAIFCLIQETD